MTSMPLSAKTSVGLSMAPTKNEENVDWYVSIFILLKYILCWLFRLV